jgi:predicted aldo/keto reductase-like oxidoreductase
VSSHLIQDDIQELLMEGVFEGVLFGYSAYNFKTREKAFDAIRAKKLGAVVMNPLGGGIVPQNPKLFDFLKRGNESEAGSSAVHAALRFLWDHRDITTTLVGFSSEAQVEDALIAMDGYKSRTDAELAEVKAHASISFEGLCTGCAYCDDCPQGVPIPKFMDSYNQQLLTKSTNDAVLGRLTGHWNVEPKKAADCIACGLCEKACTQHLPIIKRLKEIAGRAG